MQKTTLLGTARILRKGVEESVSREQLVICYDSLPWDECRQAKHDRMLRPIYHHLLQKYNFQESNNKKPCYMKSTLTAVMGNANAKILWDTSFQLDSAPENGANKIDMAILDKQGKSWLLIEGTVCQVGRMKKKNSEARKVHRSTERNK